MSLCRGALEQINAGLRHDLPHTRRKQQNIAIQAGFLVPLNTDILKRHKPTQMRLDAPNGTFTDPGQMRLRRCAAIPLCFAADSEKLNIQIGRDRREFLIKIDELR